MEEGLIVLFVAYLMDLLFGDPRWLPHLIVGYGKLISTGEQLLNKGNYLIFKGGVVTVVLVSTTFLIPYYGLTELDQISPIANLLVSILLLFYCLANRTLVKEGKAVIDSLVKEGLEAGRKRLSWIVGRETKRLNEQQIMKATFETMAENLSDGVVAPLFYFALFGVPGAMAYKMINTLDSMIGYKSDRYFYFGKIAAKLDDVVNYIPARITALLMLMTSVKLNGIGFVIKEGKKHSSPNAGYPESALAFILSCSFGGPNYYHGKLVEKPFIGTNQRLLQKDEINQVVRVNLLVALWSVLLIGVFFYVRISSL